MGFSWGTSCFKCRIAVSVVPFLLSVIFIQIRGVIAKVRFSVGFGTGSSSLCGTGPIAALQCVGQAPLQRFTVGDRPHCSSSLWWTGPIAALHCGEQAPLQLFTVGGQAPLQLFTVWDRPHCRKQNWIFHCVFGVEGDPCYVRYTKVIAG